MSSLSSRLPVLLLFPWLQEEIPFINICYTSQIKEPGCNFDSKAIPNEMAAFHLDTSFPLAAVIAHAESFVFS